MTIPGRWKRSQICRGSAPPCLVQIQTHQETATHKWNIDKLTQSPSRNFGIWTLHLLWRESKKREKSKHYFMTTQQNMMHNSPQQSGGNQLLRLTWITRKLLPLNSASHKSRPVSTFDLSEIKMCPVTFRVCYLDNNCTDDHKSCSGFYADWTQFRNSIQITHSN